MCRSLEALRLQTVASGCGATPPVESDKKEIVELAAFPVPVPRGRLYNSWACIIYQLVDSMWGGRGGGGSGFIVGERMHRVSAFTC